VKETGNHTDCIRELAERGAPCEERSTEGNHGDGANHHETDANPQVGFLVFHEARGDALVDDVALLEEQLTRS
jgi:hypothetical protein